MSKRLVDREGRTRYRFTFGPWNIHEGADPFGPPVRTSFSFNRKLKMYRDLGFEGVQFHDDDAVPDIDDKTPEQIERKTKQVRRKLDDAGLVAEFVAPRLWETPRGIDGSYTSNSARDRRYALDRSKKAIDVARILGTPNIVLWLAREGTYVREAKNAIEAYRKPTASRSTPSTRCSNTTPSAGSSSSRSPTSRWTMPTSPPWAMPSPSPT